MIKTCFVQLRLRKGRPAICHIDCERSSSIAVSEATHTHKHTPSVDLLSVHGHVPPPTLNPPPHAPRHQHNKSAPHPWPSAYMLSPFPRPTAPPSDRVTPQLCRLPSAPPSPSALLLTSCERPLGHLLATQWGQSQF